MAGVEGLGGSSRQRSRAFRAGLSLKPLTQLQTKIRLLAARRSYLFGKTEGYERIAKGADKGVFVQCTRGQIRKADDSKAHVYYAPVKKLLGLINKEKRLKKEVNIMHDIQQRSPRKVRNVAVQLEEVKGSERVAGQYTVKVEKAKCDLEDAIRSPDTSFQERLTMARDYLSGMSELHGAGYSCGDAKPENALVYPDGTTKLSDLGKGKLIGPDESVPYHGNLRFAPPEGLQSQKGDVYSSLGVVIRILEESLLSPEDSAALLPVSKENFEGPAMDERRGFERFVVEDKRFPGLDEPSLLDKLFKRLPRQAGLAKRPASELKEQEAACKDYIDAVVDRLKMHHPERSEALDKLQGLMNRMAASDPQERPTSRQVLSQFDAALGA